MIRLKKLVGVLIAVLLAVSACLIAAEVKYAVQATALPEFSTTLIGAGVAVLCLSMYCWIRRSRTASAQN